MINTYLYSYVQNISEDNVTSLQRDIEQIEREILYLEFGIALTIIALLIVITLLYRERKYIVTRYKRAKDRADRCRHNLEVESSTINDKISTLNELDYKRGPKQIQQQITLLFNRRYPLLKSTLRSKNIKLTKNEYLHLACYILKDKIPDKIEDILIVSPNTVKSTRRVIKSKCDVKSNRELVRFIDEVSKYIY